MESRTDILNELRQLSPALAGIEKVNLFSVPAGYFEGVSTVLLAVLKNNKPGVLDAIYKQQNSGVPEGYFDNLAESILNKVKLQQAETAMTELKSLSPVLNNLQQINVFQVPHNYFSNLSESILAKINTATAINELRVLSPMLYSIQNENVYKVPRGYFNELTDNLLTQVLPRQAKVVTIQKRTVWMKYAVAAAFTGVMALGAIKVFNTGSGGKGVTGTPISKADYENMMNTKVDDELAKINDADIVKYLQNNGENVELASLTNTIDPNELPSREDYMNDDKALDKYLDNINLQDLKN